MRAPTPSIVVLLAAFGLLSSVVGRAIQPPTIDLAYFKDDRLHPTHRSLFGYVKPRADIIIGEDIPPHEGSNPGDHGNGESPNPSSSGDSSSDPGILDVGPSTGGDREKILTYDQYQNRGSKVEAAIYGTIKDNEPDVIYRDMNDGYKPWEDGGNSELETCDDLEAIFKDSDVGLNAGGEYAVKEWKSVVPPPNAANGDLVHWAVYNPDEGTIVVKSVDSTLDGIPDGDPRKLLSSEITWQTWKEVAGDKKGDLRKVIRYNIDNEGTKQTLKAAYEKNNLDINKDRGDFALGKDNFELSNAFLALLGTDNVRTIDYMLKDHHQELGDKTVQRILTYPAGWGGGDTTAWTIVAIIGKDP